MKKQILNTIAACMIFCISSVAQAALIVENGQLMGATGISVNGAHYDVMFLDGTCINIFSGCDEQSDFLFDASGASEASKQLLQQVLLDVTLGLFDFTPSLTNGCGSQSYCNILTPFELGTGVLAKAAHNNTNPAADYFYDDGTNSGLGVDFNLAGFGEYTYALWTKSNIPEPGTIILLSLGLVGLSFSRYKKQYS
ncbi:PEP-CTERM sorting domain-containing protein [Alteromonadaceae bacterium BrNp21-10]|nr:PEP-CTERM sorting domain-containing protein [Alteromonadaceae bacterium BrNp21-10]